MARIRTNPAFACSLALLVGLPAAAPAGGQQPFSAQAAPAPDLHGVKLGEFVIRDYRQVENQKLRLELTVYGVVAGENREQFDRLWPRHEHRVRDQVITAVRLLPTEALDEADLHRLRRRIYLRLRRAVPELQLEEILVSDFLFLQE